MLNKIKKLSKKSIAIGVLLIVIVILLAVFKNHLPYFSRLSAAPKTYTIVLTKDGFSPDKITIKQGDTVTFTTTAGVPFWPASDLHPTHGIYPEFDPKQPVDADKSWSFLFDRVGSWHFHNHLDPLQVGTITVTGNAAVTPTNCSNATESSAKLECWQELLDSTLQTKGLPATFDLLANLYTTEPLFASECHSFAHQIGTSAYIKFQQHQEFDLNSKTSYCGYGFYHGFMEALLHTTGDIQQAQDFCKYVGFKLAGETTDGEGACYHGIGHGAVDGGDPTTWGDPEKMIQPALDMCVSVAGNDHTQYGKLYRCVSGVYNAIQILSDDPQYKLSQLQKDPFSICPSQPKEYQEACYTNMLPAVLELTQNDLLKSEAYVEKIPEASGIYAVRGPVTSSLFVEFIRMNLSAPDYNQGNAITMCHSLPDPYRLSCMYGIAEGYMKYGDPGNAYVKGLAFCSSTGLRDDETDICYNSILSRLRIWYSAEKSKEICQSVPDKFQKYCN